MPHPERKQYIYFIYQHIPDSLPSEEAGEAHWNRLEKALKDGDLLMAGRPQDGSSPAIVVFEADSGEEAQRFADEEPFVTSGFARTELPPLPRRPDARCA